MTCVVVIQSVQKDALQNLVAIVHHYTRCTFLSASSSARLESNGDTIVSARYIRDRKRVERRPLTAVICVIRARAAHLQCVLIETSVVPVLNKPLILVTPMTKSHNKEATEGILTSIGAILTRTWSPKSYGWQKLRLFLRIHRCIFKRTQQWETSTPIYYVEFGRFILCMKLQFALLLVVVFVSVSFSLSFRHKKVVEKSEPAMEHSKRNMIHHWPHLEGVDVAVAEAAIKQDRPGLKIYRMSKVSYRIVVLKLLNFGA